MYVKEEDLYHALRLMFEGSDKDKRLYLLRMSQRYPRMAELSRKYNYKGSVTREQPLESAVADDNFSSAPYKGTVSK